MASGFVRATGRTYDRTVRRYQKAEYTSCQAGRSTYEEGKHRAHHPDRQAKPMAGLRTVISSCALGLALGPAQAGGEAGFCISDLRELALDPSLLGPHHTVGYPDPGIAQMLCADCDGFRQVELFLGEDGEGREDALRRGSLTSEGLSASCAEVVPSCRVTTFVEGRSVGYATDVAYSGMAQRKQLLFNGGRVLTVRTTAAASDHDWILAAAERVFRSVLEKIHCE